MSARKKAVKVDAYTLGVFQQYQAAREALRACAYLASSESPVDPEQRRVQREEFERLDAEQKRLMHGFLGCFDACVKESGR